MKNSIATVFLVAKNPALWFVSGHGFSRAEAESKNDLGL
jgi:hypothetical protein